VLRDEESPPYSLPPPAFHSQLNVQEDVDSASDSYSTGAPISVEQQQRSSIFGSKPLLPIFDRNGSQTDDTLGFHDSGARTAITYLTAASYARRSQDDANDELISGQSSLNEGSRSEDEDIEIELETPETDSTIATEQWGQLHFDLSSKSDINQQNELEAKPEWEPSTSEADSEPQTNYDQNNHTTLPTSHDSTRASRAAKIDSYLCKPQNRDEDYVPTEEELPKIQIGGEIDPRRAWPRNLPEEWKAEKIKEIGCKLSRVTCEACKLGYNSEQTSDLLNPLESYLDITYAILVLYLCRSS
jgi:hypothetical protein